MSKENNIKVEEKEANKASAFSNDAKIDVIKELIFGNNMREYQSEFEGLHDVVTQNKLDIENKLNTAKDELYDYLEEMRKELNSKIDDLQMTLQAEIDRLDDVKTDRKMLGDLFEHMAKEIKD